MNQSYFSFINNLRLIGLLQRKAKKSSKDIFASLLIAVKNQAFKDVKKYV